MNQALPEQPSRLDVRRWWKCVVAGRCSRGQASAWAQGHLDRGYPGEELVLQGLLYLQGVDLGADPAGRSVALHLPDGDGGFYASVSEVAAALQRWLGELETLDRDPKGWERARLRRVVAGFAETHGTERARTFGEKLVRRGELTESDVRDALRE